MRIIFEIEHLIYDLKVNIGYYLKIRLFDACFGGIAFGMKVDSLFLSILILVFDNPFSFRLEI